MRQLRDYVETVRTRIIKVPSIGKTQILGAQAQVHLQHDRGQAGNGPVQLEVAPAVPVQHTDAVAPPVPKEALVNLLDGREESRVLVIVPTRHGQIHAYKCRARSRNARAAEHLVGERLAHLARVHRVVVEVERRRLSPGSIAVTVMFGQEPGIIFTTCKAIERVS